MRIPAIPGDAKLILPADAPLDEWLALRRTGIGGSDIGALLGISPSTPFHVFRAKADGWAQGPDIADRPEIEWGHRLEEAVATKAADELGLVARTGGGLWQHPEHEFAIVTPDRIATRRRSWKGLGPIECKTTQDASEWTDGEAPLHYLAQVQWQLGILGFERGWLAALALDRTRSFYLREVAFDPEWFAEMIDVAETFWVRHVLAGEPPMVDFAHPLTTGLLAELHPKVVLASVELPEEAAEWIADYHVARAEAEAADKRLEEVKNWIRFHVGDAGAGYLGDRKVVSFPEVRRTSIDTHKLREQFPKAAAACEVVSTHRRLTVSKIDR